MKKQIFLLVFISLSAILNESCNNLSGQPKSTSGKYINGLYHGESRSVYTAEPFYGKVEITVADGRLAKINFMIRDTANHETFDAGYEKHYTGNAHYIAQCRNDWKGVQNYPAELLLKQDIEKVDAVSGATWSCNIFKASTKEALKKAQKY
jgi:major membrane immunogen (membrane-anchored lipoprotein)